MPRPVVRQILLLCIAMVCFAIALIIDIHWIHSTHELAWGFAGLIAFAAAHLP
jgi:hypothetical protein